MCLKSGAEEGAKELEYPIFSIAELLENSSRVYVVQSDAIGDDGLGYLNGPIGEKKLQFYSQE